MTFEFCGSISLHIFTYLYIFLDINGNVDEFIQDAVLQAEVDGKNGKTLRVFCETVCKNQVFLTKMRFFIWYFYQAYPTLFC